MISVKTRKVTAAALIAAFIAALIVLMPVPALAGSGAITVEHVRDRDNAVKYLDGGTTSWYTANGNISYCLDPTKNGLSDTVTEGRIIARDGNELMYKALWYLYGGPGYDESLFRSDLSTDDRYGLTHVVASYIVNGSAAWDAIGFGKELALGIVEKLRGMSMPPEVFQVFFYNEGFGETQAFAGWRYNPDGRVRVVKTSSDAAITDGNPCYSLEGAVYEVKDADGKTVLTLKTGADGKTDESDEIPTGSYTLTEVTAPAGFEKDLEPIAFTVKAAETVTVNVSDKPVAADADLITVKKDAESGASPQGGGTLGGAEFTVSYYEGYYASVSALPASPSKTWVLKSDASGKVRYADEHKVRGDEIIRDASGKTVFPLGTVTVKETKVPQGYLINPETRIVQIKDSGTFAPADTADEIIRGSLYLEKWDSEKNDNVPQGSATLKGALFELFNESASSVRMGGKVYPKGSLIGTYETDETGTITVRDLPYGTYRIKETAAPAGYLLKGSIERTFDIRENGVTVRLDTEGKAIEDDPVRGDIKGIKIEDGTGKRMAGIPFRITSLSTGESHTIVTDVNGQFSTESSWNAHSFNTNRGETEDDGVWFGEISAVDDKKGALPYDSYEVEELSCEGNKDKQLLKIAVTVRKNAVTVDLGTLTNDLSELPLPEIMTSAAGENGEKILPVSERTVIVDTVSYAGLIPGTEYRLKGTLTDTETGEPVLDSGEPVTAETVFMPESSEGKTEVVFTFDSVPYAGRETVAFETLMLGETEIAVHADIKDRSQTVTFMKPSIGTHAAGEDGEKQLNVSVRTSVLDTVRYTGLAAGEEYVLKGTLMDKSTGRPVAEAETAFIPEEADGTAEVMFEFNAVPFAGHELTAFETLLLKGRELCSHKDLNDADQTVKLTVPYIGTSASLGNMKEAYTSEKTRITDTVRYGNLKKGAVYTLKGALMDKDTGKAVTVGGHVITAEKTFKAAASDGQEDMVFDLDSSSLKGKTVVVYERLYEDGTLIARHEDIEDRDQSVRFLERETNEPVLVKTGDGDDIRPFILLAIAAAGAVCAALSIRRRKEKQDA